MEHICKELEIPTKSNRVDLGVRVELPAVLFSHLTDELYESKIVYRTECPYLLYEPERHRGK